MNTTSIAVATLVFMVSAWIIVITLIEMRKPSQKEEALKELGAELNKPRYHVVVSLTTGQVLKTEDFLPHVMKIGTKYIVVSSKDRACKSARDMLFGQEVLRDRKGDTLKYYAPHMIETAVVTPPNTYVSPDIGMYDIPKPEKYDA